MMRRFLALGVFVALVVFLGIVHFVRYRHDRELWTPDLETISEALEGYAAEHHVYPTAHSMEELKARLVRKDGTPLPIRNRYDMPARLPMRDPWGRPFLIEVSQQDYSIRCLGSDGKPDRDPPRGALLDTDIRGRDTIIVDGLALQHAWNFGGGGSAGGSFVSLGRDGDAGTMIFDGPVELIRNGRVLATLSEGPARFQGPAGVYQLRVGLSGSQYFDAGTVVIESGKVLRKDLAKPPLAYVEPDGWTPSWLLLLNRRAELWQEGRLVASTSDIDATYGLPTFRILPGRYRLLIRDDKHILLDETKDLKAGDEWAPKPRQPPVKEEGLQFVMQPRGKRYAYPGFDLRGNEVHRTGSSFGDDWVRFHVPPLHYELSALLSGQIARIGRFKAEGSRWTERTFSISWGDVHLSLDGPIAIHEGSVNGWSAIARQDDKVIARTERFPDVFFLLPGLYAIDLINDGRVRSSRKVVVTAGSEQWIALQE